MSIISDTEQGGGGTVGSKGPTPFGPRVEERGIGKTLNMDFSH